MIFLGSKFNKGLIRVQDSREFKVQKSSTLGKTVQNSKVTDSMFSLNLEPPHNLDPVFNPLNLEPFCLNLESETSEGGLPWT